MKTISNLSLQGLEIYFTTEQGSSTYWLQPDEFLTIPQHYISPQIQLMADRRLLRIQEAV
jgi:hypothetical protein